MKRMNFYQWKLTMLSENSRERLAAASEEENTIELRPSDLIRSGFSHIITCIFCGFLLSCVLVAAPSLPRSRLASYESAAIGALRAVSTAEVTFQSSIRVDIDDDGTGEYGNLKTLANTDPPLIDEVLASGQKSGYHFKIVVSNEADKAEAQWWATANPAKYKRHGFRTFYIDESGVLRGSDIGGRPVESRKEGQVLPPVGS